MLRKNYEQMEAAWGKDDDAAIAALVENIQLAPDFRDTRQKLYALLIAKIGRLLDGGERVTAFTLLMRAVELQPDAVEARQRLVSYTPPPPVRPPPANAGTRPGGGGDGGFSGSNGPEGVCP